MADVIRESFGRRWLHYLRDTLRWYTWPLEVFSAALQHRYQRDYGARMWRSGYEAGLRQENNE